MSNRWKYGILNDAVVKGSSNISLNKIKDDDGDYPVYGAKGFVQNISYFHQKTDYLAIIKDGAGIGRVSKHPAKSSIVATMQYIIPKNGYDIDFVRYFIESIDFEEYRTGSTIPHVYYKDYKNAIFPLVEESEQKQIVTILDKAFAAIDQAKANIERNIENAKELFQSKLNEIFSQKGEGWEETTFQQLSSRIGDGLHGTPKYDQDGEYFFINGNNLNDGIIEIKENTKRINKEEFEKHQRPLTSNTVLISINGTLGKVAFYNNEPVILGKSACYINFDERVEKRYIKFLVQSPIFFENMGKESTGATIKNFSLKSMRNYKLSLPSKEKQIETVILLEKLDEKVKELVYNQEKRLVELEELKKSILQKAFSGELTANENILEDIPLAAEPEQPYS